MFGLSKVNTGVLVWPMSEMVVKFGCRSASQINTTGSRSNGASTATVGTCGWADQPAICSSVAC